LIIQVRCGTLRRNGRLVRRPLFDEKGDAMKKTLMALAAVATLAVSSVAAPAPAHAQRGIGAAIAGGIIGGAIVGGALAGPGYYGPGYGYYGPGYGYYGRPAYYADDYMAAASGSGSASGTVMAGGFATCGSAAKLSFIFVTNGRRRSRKQGFRERS
jgi:hypothetical protein